jgi:hypothetical protein
MAENYRAKTRPKSVSLSAVIRGGYRSVTARIMRGVTRVTLRWRGSRFRESVLGVRKHADAIR